MRTRSMIHDVSEPMGPFTVTETPPGGSPSTSTVGTVSSFRRIQGSSTIVDYPSVGRHFKSVEHASSISSRRGGDSSIQDLNLGSGTSYKYEGPGALWYSWGEFGHIPESAITATYPKDSQTLLYECLKALREDNEVDNLLNVWEAPQLLPSIQGIANNLWRLTPGKVRNNKRLILSTVSSGWLAYSFGIRPLLMDMMKMGASMKSLRANYQRYLNSNNRSVTKHVRCNGSLIVNITEPGHGNPGDGSAWHTYVSPVSVTKIATIKGVRQRPVYANQVLGKLDWWLRRYFSPGPIAALWEKVPYSFVVDWFVDSSRVISSMDETLTGSQTQILDSCISETIKASCVSALHPTSSWSPTSHKGIPMVDCIVKKYRRESLPPTEWLVGAGRFGKRQASYSVALLHQIVAKLKPRR